MLNSLRSTFLFIFVNINFITYKFNWDFEVLCFNSSDDTIPQSANTNKFALKLPLLVPEPVEKKTIINSNRGKAKIVGDIHIQIKDLKNSGADLWRTLFMFFNESIKLRKLQSLRNISKILITYLYRNEV